MVVIDVELTLTILFMLQMRVCVFQVGVLLLCLGLYDFSPIFGNLTRGAKSISYIHVPLQSCVQNYVQECVIHVLGSGSIWETRERGLVLCT